MKRINIYILSLLSAAACLGLTSCNDFLDELPDSRMEIKDGTDLTYILVSAYPEVHPAALLEMYSDNTDECRNTAWTGDRFQRQAYEWKDITENALAETPKLQWDNHYLALEHANEVIRFIEERGCPSEYNAQYGEALLCRAYIMFTLSTIFCQAYDPAYADTDLGMPYRKEPQEYVGQTYERGTLAELYADVDADLQKGLPLVTDNYSHPKFHFNRSAAYAFAARFYLYYHDYDKAIEYADVVLGTDPAAKLRDWAAWNKLSVNKMVQPNAYISTSESANLLLQVVNSQWGYWIGPYMIGEKYTHSHLIADYETISASGPWGDTQTVTGFTVFYNDDMASKMLRKIPMLFEYTDLQAGIGYVHSEYAVFNTDETLLVRAEAKILKGDYDGGLADINAELSKFAPGSSQLPLSLSAIQSYYNGISYYTPELPTPKKELHPWFDMDMTTQEPLLQCLLQLRRLVTIHEGLRLQDVKRYGIKMYRRAINKSSELLEVTDEMEKRDPRLAIQLPQEVISVGMQPNPRIGDNLATDDDEEDDSNE